jgi:hypothetical protein
MSYLMQISFPKFWTSTNYSMLIGTPTCSENKKNYITKLELYIGDLKKYGK